MGGNLRDFLVGLASSPELMAEFAADPAGTLDRAGLSADDQAAVLARDSDRLRRALGASAADHLTHVSDMAFKALKMGKKKRAKKTGAKKPAAKKRPASKRRAGTKRRGETKKRGGTKKR